MSFHFKLQNLWTILSEELLYRQTYICTYLRKLVQMAECLDHRECSVSDPRIRMEAMVVK